MSISGQALACLEDLVLGFEEEGLELPFGERAIEIKEGAVFGTLSMAGAMFFAALEKTLQQRSVEQFGGEGERAHQPGLALAQGESGSATKNVYPTHLSE
jgi:hypothetical protein